MTMSKNAKIVIICLILAVIIAVVPLLLIKDSEFGGADGQAEETITKVNSGYKPWFESLIEPPGGETESLLFSLQAGLGAGIFGFGLGYLVCRKKMNKKEK
ncbi:MAG: energy-coupling factor ABC transporter substrate-binding protein [Anaerovoracaceae bacterium]|jgi:cobalt/nickel transport protein